MAALIWVNAYSGCLVIAKIKETDSKAGLFSFN